MLKKYVLDAVMNFNVSTEQQQQKNKSSKLMFQ